MALATDARGNIVYVSAFADWQSKALIGKFPGGRVLWAEDFESPGAAINWYCNDGTKWRSARSALRSHTGRYSLRVISQGGLTDTHRTIPLDASITKLGVDSWFCFSDNLIGATNPFVGLAMERWNGTAYDEYQCLYNPNTGNYTLNFDNSPSTLTRPQALSPYNPGGVQGGNLFVSQCWHHEKLVVDILNRKFVSFRIDRETYDLSATSLLVSGTKTPTAHAQDPNMLVIEWHLNGTGIATGVIPSQLYVDDIVITDET